MDSFVFQKMINLLHYNENQINYKVFTNELDYASYRQQHYVVDGIPKKFQTIDQINIFSQGKKAISRLKLKRKTTESLTEHKINKSNKDTLSNFSDSLISINNENKPKENKNIIRGDSNFLNTPRRLLNA